MNTECIEAFTALKDKLMKAPVLAYTCFSPAALSS